jgi:hypothetical protein
MEDRENTSGKWETKKTEKGGFKKRKRGKGGTMTF